MPRPIAGAAASCFAMALALMLDENKTPPERVAASAACTLDEVESTPRITTVELTARAQVHGLEAAAFEQMVGRAADLCPVSNALRGNVEVSVERGRAEGRRRRQEHADLACHRARGQRDLRVAHRSYALERPPALDAPSTSRTPPS